MACRASTARKQSRASVANGLTRSSAENIYDLDGKIRQEAARDAAQKRLWHRPESCGVRARSRLSPAAAYRRGARPTRRARHDLQGRVPGEVRGDLTCVCV